VNRQTTSPTLQLAEFVNKHSRLFVLTGAGCSTASGLADYRDKQGQWKRPQPITGQKFINDEQARKRYWARSSVGWPSFNQAQPGPAHTALRQLQIAGYAQHLITQNVDRLHQKAMHDDVVDLHGVLATVSCIDCKNTVPRDDFQANLLRANPWLNSLTARHAPDGDADLEWQNLEIMQVPHCANCSGILKPDVVFFGESVAKPVVLGAMDALSESDALCVVGSSLMVYSGYRFALAAQKLEKPIVIINDGTTRADNIATLLIDGDCGQRLTELNSTLKLSRLGTSERIVSLGKVL